MVVRAEPELVERRSRLTRYPLQYARVPLQPAMILPGRQTPLPRVHAMDDAGTIYTRPRMYSIAPLNVEFGYMHGGIDPETLPEFDD